MARALRPAALARGTAALALVCACGPACGSGNPVIEGTPPRPLPRTTILGVEVTVHGTATATGASIGIEAIDDFFSPTIVSGAAGTRLRIVLRNDGLHPHNFSIPSSGVSTDVPPGEVRPIDVRFPSSGRLAFFCRFHRMSAAMVGALAVLGPAS